MKSLKIVSTLAVILIGIFSFSKSESTSTALALNLDELNLEEILSKQVFECRPSEQFAFYVETDLVKKYRGYSKIKASVYVLDRFSGASNLLTNQQVIVPNHKDTSLRLNENGVNKNNITLPNGDKIVGGNINSKYSFDKLIQYETIYRNYVAASNNLLDMHRTL